MSYLVIWEEKKNHWSNHYAEEKRKAHFRPWWIPKRINYVIIFDMSMLFTINTCVVLTGFSFEIFQWIFVLIIRRYLIGFNRLSYSLFATCQCQEVKYTPIKQKAYMRGRMIAQGRIKEKEGRKSILFFQRKSFTWKGIHSLIKLCQHQMRIVIHCSQFCEKDRGWVFFGWNFNSMSNKRKISTDVRYRHQSSNSLIVCF